MTDAFALDPRLAADTIALLDFDLCTLRLMNDRQFPWLILVPQRANLREIHDLSESDQPKLLAEILRTTRALQRLLTPVKLNVAALGNSVAQLHVHVIARFTTDPAWPKPVWGVVAPIPYGEPEAIALRVRLEKALK